MIDTINRRPTKTELHLTLDDLNFLIDTYLEDRGQRTKVYTTAIQYDKLSFFLRFWATHGPTVKWRLTVDTFPAFNIWLDQHISAATGRGLATQCKQLAG